MASRFPAITDELLARLDVPGPRYTSYPTVPEWTTRFGAAEHAAALERAATAAGPLSLYVHIPFCRDLCSYCGCNVVVSRDPARADAYLQVVEREIALSAERLGARRRVARLHLGGGTPTFLDERQLATLWRTITARFTITDDAELAIEVDPVVTRREQLALLAAFGFNRLSMGVQDFDPEVQRTVRREQSVALTRETSDTARALGFRSVNFDLIYGLPRQTPATWRSTVEEVVRLGPDRIACFSFAYLPDVKPHQKRLPASEIPRGRAKLDLLAIAHDGFVDAGYRAIGMDHFARPEDELAQAQARGALWRDFQGYTVWRAADSVAFGVTGISDVGGAYAQNVKSIADYRIAVEAGQLPTERGLVLSDDDRRRRAIITELMCNLSVDLGADATDFTDELSRLEPLQRDGLVERAGSVITLTPLGRVFVRNVAMVFDAYLPRDERRRFSRTV